MLFVNPPATFVHNQWRIQDLTLGGAVDFVNGVGGGVENY